MFVVVYLTVSKKHIAVPETWIYNINQELLKNHGVNSNRNVLIFWSKKGFVDGKPNEEFSPNFQLDRATAFPPQNNEEEACYIGRLKKYFGKYHIKVKITKSKINISII